MNWNTKIKIERNARAATYKKRGNMIPSFKDKLKNFKLKQITKVKWK